MTPPQKLAAAALLALCLAYAYHDAQEGAAIQRRWEARQTERAALFQGSGAVVHYGRRRR
jgi:hypothetical protein